MPPVMSQLLSFSFSIPFVLALALLADLPVFAAVVLVSCAAAACRPLRFRSRFIAIALCTSPQLFYWAYFGGLQKVEPLQWGISFGPWICAWITMIVFAGIVLLVGHFTRYRPGLTWIAGAVTLVSALIIFQQKVGFDELAYQQYIAKNNPEQVAEFRDQSIRQALDNTINNPNSRKYFANFLYPTDPARLRQELKEEIQVQLARDRWPSWFIVPENMNFPVKRQWLLGQYDLFIDGQKPWWMPARIFEKVRQGRLKSKRMPVVLYYKAILSEALPDPKLISEKELLHFNDDYPHKNFVPIWYKLYEDFPNSTESIEARRRVAMHLAGQKLFDMADTLVREAQKLLSERMVFPDQSTQTSGGGLFTAFAPSKTSAMSELKLLQLQRDLNDLHGLLKTENLPSDPQEKERLAKYIMLNPHSPDYLSSLESMLNQMNERENLYGKVLLEKTLLTRDPHTRLQELKKMSERFKETEIGVAALYELSVLKVRIWQDQTRIDDKKKLLTEARSTLMKFISLYPRSFYKANAQTILNSLPGMD
jgi:hypothetical protein